MYMYFFGVNQQTQGSSMWGRGGGGKQKNCRDLLLQFIPVWTQPYMYMYSICLAENEIISIILVQGIGPGDWPRNLHLNKINSTESKGLHYRHYEKVRDAGCYLLSLEPQR